MKKKVWIIKGNKVSHDNWWDGWQDIAKGGLDTVGSWFAYKGQQSTDNAAASVAASAASSETAKAKIAAETRKENVQTALIIGGSVLAVVLIITLILIFRKK